VSTYLWKLSREKLNNTNLYLYSKYIEKNFKVNAKGDFNEIWNFRDLLLIFIRRDIITQYKQTILGPLWFFIQPLILTIVFTIIGKNQPVTFSTFLEANRG